MRKTKADMEKEISYLKLQLNIIAERLQDISKMDEYALYKKLGAVIYTATNFQENFDYIQQHNLPYDFFDGR